MIEQYIIYIYFILTVKKQNKQIQKTIYIHMTEQQEIDSLLFSTY